MIRGYVHYGMSKEGMVDWGSEGRGERRGERKEMYHNVANEA